MPELKTLQAQQLVLASASPRRRELLLQLHIDHWCIPASIDETMRAGESPEALVARLATEKASTIGEPAIEAYCRDQGLVRPEKILVLGADTVIDLDGQILGKPRDEDDAVQMLEALSDRKHRVITGVCVCEPGGARDTITVSTVVQFAPISDAAARSYWRTGEPSGKAGSYAIQGYAARFIVHLAGSYSNVVGLPLFETVQLLEKHGLQDHV